MTFSEQPVAIVRTAGTDDLDALLTLEEEAFSSDQISRQSFRRLLKSPSARILVAENIQREVVGYAILLIRKDSTRARMYSIAVADAARGQGIGTQLLGAVETLALESHRDVLTLEVRADADRVRELYERVGFDEVARLPAYYEDGADGLRMVKTLRKRRTNALPTRSRVPLILVDRRKDLAIEPASGRILSTREYLALGHGVPGRTVINLSRSYEPLARGYYCSLLAEARGERCLPGPDSILDVNWKRIHRSALSEVEPLLRAISGPIPETIDVYFGTTEDPRFSEVGSALFDRFRCPILRVSVDSLHEPTIDEIEAVAVTKLEEKDKKRFTSVLNSFLRSRAPIARSLPRAATTIAVLVDPEDDMPPSDEGALKRFERSALDLGARITFVTRKDLHRLSQFDALLIRETTRLDHHTYRFARKAEREGMPVIDSPEAILKCTNKIFLYELLRTHRIPTPATTVFDSYQMEEVEKQIAYPAVLKIPDGCFSQGVFRVDSPEDLRRHALSLFEESDLLLVQSFVSTTFDWRIGVLDGEALYACRYFMAPGHWQIVHMEESGEAAFGDWQTIPVHEAPPDIVSASVRAAGLIGSGLFGVDVKETPTGPLVIEVNDNPNLDEGVEDAVLGDDLYRRILLSLLNRVGGR